MSVPHRLGLLGFQHTSIRKCLGRHAFIGRGIDGVNFIAANCFPICILTITEQDLQVITQLAMHQRIVDTAEFAPKQRRLTQGNGRTDLPTGRQGIYQIQNGGVSPNHFLVYCFSELAEFCFCHRKRLFSKFHFLLKVLLYYFETLN